MNKSIRLLGILLGSSSLLFLSACKKETTVFDSTGPACKITVLRTVDGYSEINTIEYDSKHRVTRVQQPGYTLSIDSSGVLGGDTTFYFTHYTYEMKRIITKQWKLSTKTQQETETSNPADTLLLDSENRVIRTKNYEIRYTNEGYIGMIISLDTSYALSFSYQNGEMIKQTELINGQVNSQIHYTYYTDKEDKYIINGLTNDYRSLAHSLTALGAIYGKPSKHLIKTRQYNSESPIASMNYQFNTSQKPISVTIEKPPFTQIVYHFSYDSSCY